MGFFSSLFSSTPVNEEEEKEKEAGKNFDILKYDGIRAQRMGQLQYATKCFEEALNIENDFETKGHLVAAYTAGNRLEEALKLVSEMVEEEPTHVDTRLLKINLLLMLDKNKEVIDECQIITDSDPSNANAWFKMARAKKDIKDDLGALTAVSKALALESKIGDVFRLRADILLEMAQYNDAIEDINKAIELMPEDETHYWQRGNIYRAQKDYDKAKKDYETSMELNPFFDKGIIAEGSLLIDQNKLDEALTFLNNVIEDNENSSDAYAERGKVKRLLGDDKGAMEDLKKSIELDPSGETAKKCNGAHSNFDTMYQGGIY